MATPEIRVGLLGLGTVGAGVAEILSKHRRLLSEQTGARLTIARALVKRPRRKRGGAAARVSLTSDPARIVSADDIDLVVELIGGIEPARSYVLEALAHGKPVVTANKAIMAAHGARLLRAAASSSTDIYFEAAVAGGIPIIRTLREGLASDRITQILGILNGTTNFVLEKMAAGAGYDPALREAQRLGFAEADPTLDVSGRDAADKLGILAHLAYGTTLSTGRIPTEGIASLVPEVMADAQALGYRVKLVAVARRAGNKLDVRVHPALVADGDLLSNVPGAQNAIAVTSDSLGTTLYQGPGAGGLPTGSAVVSDLIEATRNLRAGVSGRVATGGRSAPALLDAKKSHSAYYLRLLVVDRPGVLASVTKILAERGISLATVLQRERGEKKGSSVPVVLMTHQAPWGAMAEAARRMRRLPAVRGKGHLLRIV